VLALVGLDSLIRFPEGGLALVGACHTGIRMLAGIEEPLLIWDMAILTMVGAIFRPLGTLMDIHHAKSLM